MVGKIEPCKKDQGKQTIKNLVRPFQNPRLTTTTPSADAQSSNRPRGHLPKAGTEPCSHSPCPFKSSSPGTCLVASPLFQQAGPIGRPGEAPIAPLRIRTRGRPFARRACSCGVGLRAGLAAGPVVAVCGAAWRKHVGHHHFDPSPLACGMRHAACMQCRQGCRAEMIIMC
jgi:hypothetical protein